MNLKQLSERAHKMSQQKGFWDEQRQMNESLLDIYLTAKLMLIVSELGEACEARRKGDINNFNEEIADTIIRLLDLCGFLELDIEKEIEKKMKINEARPKKHGKKF
jgi:NTP pyrophosphatase (non-canonical NTP hydrolase)